MYMKYLILFKRSLPCIQTCSTLLYSNLLYFISFCLKVVLPLAAEAPKPIVQMNKSGRGGNNRGRGSGRGGRGRGRGEVQAVGESRSGDIESDEVQNPMQMQTRPRS